MQKSLLKCFVFTVVSAVLACLTGCAGIEPPSPKQIIEHPFGTSMLRAGLTKDQVLAQWGEPDLKEFDNTGKWGNAKERWTYYGRMSGLPLDEGYLTKTQYLYFDGKNLARYNE
ncbi:MAG: hypothetical protein PHR22_02965 [Candidatus Omnitrophica bacterium]|nr:hypothetical protein [Candidatus Omnitrophota bacterium]